MLGSSWLRHVVSITLASASIAFGAAVVLPWLRCALVKPRKEETEEDAGEAPSQEFGVLLFYEYAVIVDVPSTRQSLEKLCRDLDLQGRLRISEEGFNGNLSGSWVACQSFVAAVQKDYLEFRGTDFKLAPCSARHLFRSLKVWTSDEVCGLFAAQDGSERAIAARSLAEAERGHHLSPHSWHEMMQSAGNDVVLFDVRNRYETRIGRFARCGSSQSERTTVHPATGDANETGMKLLDPNTRFFHEVPEYLSREETLESLRGKKVMMYCTGGVRCERASALLKQRLGDQADVYQLAGGIQRYLEAYPDGGYFEGSMHVFDRRGRISAPDCVAPGRETEIEAKPHAIIGRCVACALPWDAYQGKWKCSKCGLLILICPRCQGHYSNNGKRLTLLCELCDPTLFHGDVIDTPPKKLANDVSQKGSACATPPRLETFGSRAHEVASCYHHVSAASLLHEVLSWLNSRRLRVKIVADSSALHGVGKLWILAEQHEDFDVAVGCAQVAERLLRDQASRQIVWQSLKPEVMALWLLRCGHIGKSPSSDQVALQILWRLVEIGEARHALCACTVDLQSALLAACQRLSHDDDVVRRELCMVVRYFSENSNLRAIICAKPDIFGPLVSMAVESAEQAVALTAKENSSAEGLAASALAALVVLKTTCDVCMDIEQRIDTVARRALDIYCKSKQVKKWVDLLLAHRTKHIAASVEPVSPGALQLVDVPKLAMLRKETAVRVREVWLERFSAANDAVAGVMARDEYTTFRAASNACPTFIGPLRRQSEILNFVWQYQSNKILYQTLDAYKGGAAGAGAGRADLVLTLMPDLLESHGIVLLHGLICSDLLSKPEAAELMRFTRCAYTQPTWLTLVKEFNFSSTTFDFDAFLLKFQRTF